MLISDVTQSKASPKYEKCTFADTGRLNSTLDIPGFLPRKRLAVQKFHVMWKHHGLFGAFSSFHICFAIWLIRGFRRYGWKLFAAYPDLFSRCFHLGMDLWKSYCTCWICCSVSTEKLFTTLYPVTYPLKCHPKGFFTKDPVYIYIYWYITYIVFFSFIYRYTHIDIYIYICIYWEWSWRANSWAVANSCFIPWRMIRFIHFKPRGFIKSRMKKPAQGIFLWPLGGQRNSSGWNPGANAGDFFQG